MQSQPNTRPLATDSSLVPIGIDDGYAVTKLALADGRLLAIPSAARVGRSNVSWMPRAEQLIFEYETEGTVFSVGDVDASSTRFEGYSSSALNRACRSVTSIIAAANAAPQQSLRSRRILRHRSHRARPPALRKSLITTSCQKHSLPGTTM